VLTPSELLIEGEKLLGNYNVEVARWQVDRWVSTVPPLYVILTDHRIILQPHIRKRYEPAIIPVRYLARVVELDAPPRRGVILHLTTGHQIGMFIASHKTREVLHNLHKMMQPVPPRFNAELDLGSLRKIIDVVQGL
jgi:hypothetical protein